MSAPPLPFPSHVIEKSASDRVRRIPLVDASFDVCLSDAADASASIQVEGDYDNSPDGHVLVPSAVFS